MQASGRMLDVKGGGRLDPPVETGGYKMLDMLGALFLLRFKLRFYPLI